MTDTFAINIKDIKKLRSVLAAFSARGFKPTTSCVIPTKDGAVLLFTLDDGQEFDEEPEADDDETIDADVSAVSKPNGHANPPVVELANPEIVPGSQP